MSDLEFSVQLKMVTDQFNKNLKELQSGFGMSIGQMVKTIAELSQGSEKASEMIKALNNAGDDKLSENLKKATSELNALKNGAKISGDDIVNALEMAANHTENLRP